MGSQSKGRTGLDAAAAGHVFVSKVVENLLNRLKERYIFGEKKGKELMATGGLLNATVKFDPDDDTPIPGGDGGNAGGPAPIIGGFYVHSLSDKWKWKANLCMPTTARLK